MPESFQQKQEKMKINTTKKHSKLADRKGKKRHKVQKKNRIIFKEITTEKTLNCCLE